MKQDLKITIAGASATGKSRVMMLIEKLLIENGFDVEIDVETNFDFKDVDDFHKKTSINFDECIDRIKSKTKIKIVLTEQQTKINLASYGNKA